MYRLENLTWAEAEEAFKSCKLAHIIISRLELMR